MRCSKCGCDLDDPARAGQTLFVGEGADPREAAREFDGDRLGRLGTDHYKWAAEFRSMALRLGYSDMDEGWLAAWFANALMAGRDAAREPQADALDNDVPGQNSTTLYDGEADAPTAFRDFCVTVTAWATATFGQSTDASRIEHMSREVEELRQNPTDAAEMADVLMLLIHHAGAHGVDLHAAAALKFEELQRRKWGQPDAQGVVEHVRDTPTTREVEDSGHKGALAASSSDTYTLGPATQSTPTAPAEPEPVAKRALVLGLLPQGISFDSDLFVYRGGYFGDGPVRTFLDKMMDHCLLDKGKVVLYDRAALDAAEQRGYLRGAREAEEKRATYQPAPLPPLVGPDYGPRGAFFGTGLHAATVRWEEIARAERVARDQERAAREQMTAWFDTAQESHRVTRERAETAERDLRDAKSWLATMSEDMRLVRNELVIVKRERAQAWADRDEARRQVAALDCRYTGGGHADTGGSHCPLDKQCVSCQRDALLLGERKDGAA